MAGIPVEWMGQYVPTAKAVEMNIERINNRGGVRMKHQVINMHELIPKGLYCYDERGTCHAWGRSEHKSEQENGFCTFMMIRDWEAEGISLLWDQVKECGINMEWEDK